MDHLLLRFATVLTRWKVLITDYPDEELVENLKFNVDNCEYLKTSRSEIDAEVSRILVCNYIS